MILLKTLALLFSLTHASAALPEKTNPSMSLPTAEWTDLAKTAAEWKAHYKVDDPYTKITDNNGDGDEDLYGTRNFRVVLHGVYYRGGANNSYNKYGKRNNMNPLPNGGLKNLCEEGFSHAVYFYPINFKTAPTTTTCGDSSGSNQLIYKQITAFKKDNYEPLLDLIFQRIKGQLYGPIYGHCWNGWHASGLIASLALQQYCDWTNQEAGDYWIKNTDGNSKGYNLILNQIKSFKKIARLEISAAEKTAICPAH